MPSVSPMSVRNTAHISSNWCQSRQERARRETSIPRTRPTWPRPTSATRRWKPGLSEVEAPERPRSSSMTTTWARRARAPKISTDTDARAAPPAEPAGAIRQTILEARRFPVLLNLAQGRLADVDNRVAIAMAGLDLLRRRIARRKPHLRAHGRPPDLRTGAAG